VHPQAILEIYNITGIILSYADKKDKIVLVDGKNIVKQSL